MVDLIPIKRAILSVNDKTDLAPFAKALVGRGVEIISTGGTARALEEAGVPVTHIDAITGFPEIMDGRVKTLHPKVHGALLAVRDNPDHQRAMQEHDIAPIDLVCVNLYPFERAVAEPDIEQREAIEMIDIGGPSMIRSAAKNFDSVTVVTSPRQYDRVINDLEANDGATSWRLRASLAASAFGRTAEYDAAIASYLGRRSPGGFPEIMRISYMKVEELRYGENPHQDAALYRDPASTGPTIVNATQLHGRTLSYNNIGDASAALEVVKDLRRGVPDQVGAAIVKHLNTCGAAIGPAARDAVDSALAGDPLAAYGGILAVNREFDAPAAERLCEKGVFLEVVIASSFTDDALEILRANSANMRLLAVGDRKGSSARKLDFRSIPGGLLLQDRDTRTASTEQWRHAAGPAPAPERLVEAAFVWTIVKHLGSNALAIGGADASRNGVVRLFGVGAGQMDRVTACRLAVEKAGDRARGAIGASDAFFPFPDGPEILISAGVDLIVHPGGSKRDDETFALCEQRGVTCLVTGVRHFRH
ncbi:MAG: bifunctional phosphoribosylaminoimidazolecarboxamide formyltransferase/IMP cyclohydrolase PurH [Phycisphaeraceae bacterium]|nr:MAG: bifunctional phosphoribosylaminoimidazolecarboxamide formyltransferase/IMP cyclohydrolase PurH [Phycisphaeraceae bacterium]